MKQWFYISIGVTADFFTLPVENLSIFLVVRQAEFFETDWGSDYGK
jgi:hypothetical protein